jgi:hypothetical protein
MEVGTSRGAGSAAVTEVDNGVQMETNTARETKTPLETMPHGYPPSAPEGKPV